MVENDLKKIFLKQKQSLPLGCKIKLAQLRIKQWHDRWNGNVYVSFSGGKDSTVLLHLVRSLYPSVPAVFIDTGLEFPEIRQFATMTNNVIVLLPKLHFRSVLAKYGYPVVSKEVSQKIYEIKTTKSKKLLHKRLHGENNKYKSGKLPEKWKYLLDAPFKISHKCCDIMKKNPARAFERKSGLLPFIGTMTEDSHLRRQQYIRSGCNSFEGGVKQSKPLSIWTQKDIWDYIRLHKLSYSKIYNMGYKNTGCMFCAFGIHREKSDMFIKNKFETMRETHPLIYKYCLNKLGMKQILDIMGINY